MSKRKRMQTVIWPLLFLALFVMAWSHYVIGQDPFAPEPPFEWRQSEMRGWSVFSATQRVPIRSRRDAHPIVRGAFEPLLIAAQKSEKEFKGMFIVHESSDPGQSDALSRLLTILLDRDAQTDIQ